MTLKKDCRIIAIIPAFDEETKIGKVVSRIPRDSIHEILVIDDGSTDGTVEEARAEGATVINHGMKKGIGVAIRTGIEQAIKREFDVIVVLAGNNKDFPEEIPRLLEPIMNDGYDYVQGSRYLEGGKYGKMPLHRRLVTRIYPLLLRLTTGFPATDGTNGFRAYRCSLFQDKRINIWQRWLDDPLEYYLSIKVIKLGYKVT